MLQVLADSKGQVSQDIGLQDVRSNAQIGHGFVQHLVSFAKPKRRIATVKRSIGLRATPPEVADPAPSGVLPRTGFLLPQTLGVSTGLFATLRMALRSSKRFEDVVTVKPVLSKEKLSLRHPRGKMRQVVVLLTVFMLDPDRRSAALDGNLQGIRRWRAFSFPT